MLWLSSQSPTTRQGETGRGKRVRGTKGVTYARARHELLKPESVILPQKNRGVVRPSRKSFAGKFKTTSLGRLCPERGGGQAGNHRNAPSFRRDTPNTYFLRKRTMSVFSSGRGGADRKKGEAKGKKARAGKKRFDLQAPRRVEPFDN